MTALRPAKQAFDAKALFAAKEAVSKRLPAAGCWGRKTGHSPAGPFSPIAGGN